MLEKEAPSGESRGIMLKSGSPAMPHKKGRAKILNNFTISIIATVPIPHIRDSQVL
jgi:hypothetical protein